MRCEVTGMCFRRSAVNATRRAIRPVVQRRRGGRHPPRVARPARAVNNLADQALVATFAADKAIVDQAAAKMAVV